MEQVNLAHVALNTTYAVDKPYLYRLGQELAEQARPGMVIYTTYQTAYVDPDRKLAARLPPRAFIRSRLV